MAAARYAEMNGTLAVNVVLADAATAAGRGWLGPVPSYVGPGWSTTDGGQTWTSGSLPVPIDQANGQTLRDRATQALTANATFLAAAKPATAAAQASQAYDQTVRLTRECSALIRLFLGALEDVAGT